MTGTGNVTTRQVFQLINQAAAGALGGTVAGAMAGVIEVLALLILRRSPQILLALPYAVVAYGLLGLVIGSLLALLLIVWALLHRRTDEPVGWTGCAAPLFAALVVIVLAYQLWQGLLGGRELFPGTIGYAISMGVLILVVDVAVILTVVLRRRWPWPATAALGTWWVGLLGYAVLLVGSGLLAALAAQMIPAPVALPPVMPASPEHPNVIVLVADALRADHLGCYAQRSVDGNARATTPQIDTLAADGVLYRDMQSQSSWTKPSVATILTSLYPSSHRADSRDAQLSDAAITLPEILASQGYRTAAFVTNLNLAPVFNFQQGFHEYHYLDPDYYFWGSPAAANLCIYAALMNVLGFLPETVLYHPRFFYRPASTVHERLLPWLDSHRSERFFVYVHYMDPHDPYFERPLNGRALVAVRGQTDPAQGPSMQSLYAGEIAYLDTNIGELLAALKLYGLYDRTLIVFTADHGEEFFEHGDCSHGATLYEEQVRVPLIVKYPQGIAAGTVDPAPARSLDIAPTVLDVLDIEIPTSMQGVSLHPDSRATRPATVFFEENLEGNTLQAIRMANYKLILANQDNPRGLAPVEIYDLAVDPDEQMNLAAVHPAVVQQLQLELDRILIYARAHAVVGETSELDPATRERLRQLGY